MVGSLVAPRADWWVEQWAAVWAACSADSTVALWVAERVELRVVLWDGQTAARRVGWRVFGKVAR